MGVLCGFGKRIEDSLTPCGTVLFGHDWRNYIDQLRARGRTHSVAVLKQSDHQRPFYHCIGCIVDIFEQTRCFRP